MMWADYLFVAGVACLLAGLAGALYLTRRRPPELPGEVYVVDSALVWAITREAAMRTRRWEMRLRLEREHGPDMADACERAFATMWAWQEGLRRLGRIMAASREALSTWCPICETSPLECRAPEAHAGRILGEPMPEEVD